MRRHKGIWRYNGNTNFGDERTFRSKNMKKTLKTLFLSILFLSVGATAQAQFKLGITAGLNISQVKVDDGDYKQFVDKVRPGFIVGPTAIFTIPKTGLGFDASAW